MRILVRNTIQYVAKIPHHTLFNVQVEVSRQHKYNAIQYCSISSCRSPTIDTKKVFRRLKNISRLTFSLGGDGAAWLAAPLPFLASFPADPLHNQLSQYRYLEGLIRGSALTCQTCRTQDSECAGPRLRIRQNRTCSHPVQNSLMMLECWLSEERKCRSLPCMRAKGDGWKHSIFLSGHSLEHMSWMLAGMRHLVVFGEMCRSRATLGFPSLVFPRLASVIASISGWLCAALKFSGTIVHVLIIVHKLHSMLVQHSHACMNEPCAELTKARYSAL